MRIVALQPYADGAGHMAKYTARLCQQMGKLEHRVVLCTNVIELDQYLTEKPLFRLEQLGSDYSFFSYEQRKIDASLQWLFARIRNNIATLRRALQVVKKEQFDVVQLFSYELVSTWLFLACFWKSDLPPIVIEIAAANFSSEKYYGSSAERLWRRLQKIAIKRMLGRTIQAVCMNSASHIPELRKQLDLDSDFKVELVLDTREIPEKRLDQDEARARVGLADYKGCVFLFFGTLRRDKGIESLLAAVTMLQSEEFRLIIAGMPLDWEISTEAQKVLSLKHVVAHIEYVPEEKIDALFFASDALLLPYGAVYAGSSGPLFEAAARGLPVIVSDVSEMGAITRARDIGIVVPPDNPDALAAAMKEFITTDASEKARWSENALSMLRNNDRTSVAQRFIEVYKKVTSS